MERGEKRLELQVDVRAPPRGEDARPSSPGASTAAHPRGPGVLYRYVLDLRIGRHKSCVSVLGALRCAKVGRSASWGAWADGATCARLVLGRMAVPKRDR